MASETFSPSSDLLPDWSAAGNWSGGAVPGAGTQAVVDAADAYIDPQTTLSAEITLEGGAALIGNDGGFLFSPGAFVFAADSNALYADGAIVNEGTIAMAGGTLTVVVGAGSQIAATYGLAEPSFENEGGVAVAGGTLAIEGSEFSNVGTVYLSAGGVLSVAGGWTDGGQTALPPGGDISIAGGGLASFGDGVVDQQFVFGGPGTIAFADPVDVRAVAITDFGYRDEILVPSVAAAETLLAEGLTFTTPLPSGETLAILTVASGAAIIAEAAETIPPCFARGTRLLTPGGYVPVEHIHPGDLVITAAGGAERVRWVGWRGIDLTDHARPAAVQPIRVTAGAIADGVPACDVVLSPDHALYLAGHLVPVKFLVNGATILRETGRLAVTYFHLELERHDVVLAENLPAETYIDTGNRGLFENTAGAPWRSPVFGRGKQWDDRAYAPLCDAGPVLREVRRRLFDRLAGMGYRHQVLPDVVLEAGGRKIGRSFGTAWLPCFELPPAHDGQVAIRSATFVPAELALGEGDDEDWRVLGAGIRRIRVDNQIFAPARLARSGFHARAKGDIADWTDGRGVIRVPPGSRVIGLNLLALPKAWLIMPEGPGGK